MPTYTVIGLRDDNGDLIVAGVCAGEVPMVDSQVQTGPYFEYSRWASSFEAADPDAAEAMAVAACEDEDQDGIEDDEDDEEHNRP